MAQNATVEQYVKNFSTFSGADIIATFNSRTIGELQAITYTVTREVAPVYTFGNANPRSFSRGKRGIAGSLVFVFFDRNALMEEMNKEYAGLPKNQGVQAFAANVGKYQDEILRGALSREGYAGIAKWDEIMTDLGYSNMLVQNVPAEYTDQIMPFNITINFANEFGQRAQFDIYHVQVLNSGMAISIDDIVTEQAMSFVATDITEPHKVTN